MWWIYALLSALFASLTAIFAKVGITNVNSNLATGQFRGVSQVNGIRLRKILFIKKQVKRMIPQ